MALNIQRIKIVLGTTFFLTVAVATNARSQEFQGGIFNDPRYFDKKTFVRKVIDYNNEIKSKLKYPDDVLRLDVVIQYFHGSEEDYQAFSGLLGMFYKESTARLLERPMNQLANHKKGDPLPDGYAEIALEGALAFLEMYTRNPEHESWLPQGYRITPQYYHYKVSRYVEEINDQGIKVRKKVSEQNTKTIYVLVANTSLNPAIARGLTTHLSFVEVKSEPSDAEVLYAKEGDKKFKRLKNTKAQKWLAKGKYIFRLTSKNDKVDLKVAVEDDIETVFHKFKGEEQD